ncbi:winged helix-turn-helix transcriptional regulator [Methanosarcina sp.]|uniref:winged helix-turn-helix transcriptional regulator n=2 Tax=Methanosarcina sp. TaxID=2213 RepID=UPI002988DD99|nr:winged helix-turn-helix transcriptional regulator [Methanosarcina sp.]MDW5558095.1 winged helix-turn-helix transcriptional regulator [Methanosarcina sp.]
MEHRAIHLMFTSTKLEKKLIFFLLFFLLTITAQATEYIVSPAPGDQAGASINGEKVVELEVTQIPYWQFLLWLAAMQILSIIDVLLCFAKLIFVVLGFKIVDKRNILDNPDRSSIYTYIRAKPGAYIGEIVEKTGLGRGRVRHHITILEVQNKIEVHEDGGKIRYFENNSTYDEEERKIISALQNVTNQRIISEIQNGKCNTNSALAHEIGVSRATISWYMRTLKEVELINEERKGKNIIYRVNPSYENLIEKYG